MFETLLVWASLLFGLFVFNTAFGILVTWIIKARRKPKKEAST